MVKKKQKNKKKLRLNRKILVVTVILFVLTILIVGMYFNQKPNQKTNTLQPRSTSSNTKNDLNNPAVAEAKATADKYFEAVSNCDLETANTLRILPKNITQSKEDCQKECPGGLTYKHIKPLSYNSSESGGITTEIATFDYAFGCGDKTYPTIMQMIRSSEDNIWLVFNMG